MSLQQRAAMLAAKTFLGVPGKDFEKGGREQLIHLLRAGLKPGSRLVDLGCGVLRAGYWLIHFLDPGCYCGIEPHQGRLEMGVHTILEPGMLDLKHPRFDTNPHFDTSVFGDKFDFFLAYSVWTHAAKQQIEIMLDSFLRDSTDDAVFLTSYLPANWRHADYRGEQWYGTSHESDVPGCIYHRIRWIHAQYDQRGLTLRKLGRDETHGQSWIELRRLPQSQHL
jgi:hypothetical protein